MKIKGIIFIVILALASCEVTEDQNLLIPSSNDLVEKLREVMSLPVGTPSGKLYKVVNYGGDSEIIYSTREIYYPSTGNASYHVIRDQNQDTVAFGLNYYQKEDQIETSFFFSYKNGKPVWQSTKEYVYVSGNLPDKIFATTATTERRLFAQFRYNSQHHLTQIEYPNGNGPVEVEAFGYDEQARISSEWKTVLGQEDHKIDYLVYRYNGKGLLEAKESGIRGILSSERQDAFQYFYNDQGKLVLQKEFDPYFDFQQKGSSEFFYHAAGSQ